MVSYLTVLYCKMFVLVWFSVYEWGEQKNVYYALEL